MAFEEYRQEVVKFLKEKLKDVDEELDILDTLNIVALLQIAALRDIEELPSYQGNDLPVLSIKQACRTILKHSKVRKLNKLVNKMYLIVLDTIKTGNLKKLSNFFSTVVVKYVDIMKLFPMLLKDPRIFESLTKEFESLGEEELKREREEQDESNR